MVFAIICKMGEQMKKLFLGCMSLVFGGMMVSFGVLIGESLVFVVPSIVGLIGFLFCIGLLLRQIFMGDTVYLFEDNELYAENKQGRVKIQRQATQDVTFLCDRYTDELEMVLFVHNGKKHRMQVNANNTEAIQVFFEQRRYKQRSLLYYVVECLTI